MQNIELCAAFSFKRNSLQIGFVVVMICFLFTTAFGQQTEYKCKSNFAPDRIIVKFKSHVTPDEIVHGRRPEIKRLNEKYGVVLVYSTALELIF